MCVVCLQRRRMHKDCFYLHLLQLRVLTPPLMCNAVMCFTYAQVFVLLDGFPFDLLELNH